ncbi:YfiT family bacillithiol transferase [Polaribacter aquimarinus]|uniref:Putative metal-dependent hydrolase n=1 Tax=Polaribacter aquimarinus TaxID=2100726 RepID=A0A2U2J9X2_9FLAO|nr:putative metal-dependent hydrolase [Polaribacter aquimarinus]PWG05139.1 putative metal-dependent hydrolase [Polaribacter aquimarinus]
MDLEKLKYPIGKANIPENISKKDLETWISDIERFPHELEFLVRELSQNQLDTAYREGGWTIRQVIHHSYDSHHNSYTRFKWALTEDKPIIKAYYEERWAELSDSKSGPILLTIDALKALHAKWVYFLKGLSDKELQTTFIHPDGNETVTLKENIGIYAWHCQHHYAHIEQLMIRKGWK